MSKQWLQTLSNVLFLIPLQLDKFFFRLKHVYMNFMIKTLIILISNNTPDRDIKKTKPPIHQFTNSPIREFKVLQNVF